MNNITPLVRNYLDKYLFSVRSQGRYMFTLEELKEHFNSLSDAGFPSLAPGPGQIVTHPLPFLPTQVGST